MPDGAPPAAAALVVVAIAGAAGSGKTTLGRALARALGSAILDLDEVTNPLLDALGALIPGPHWAASPAAESIRTGRYGALRAAAADNVRVGRGVVLVAPFTAELRGGPQWEDLVRAVAPAQLRLVHLVGAPELLDRRRRARGSVRDAHRPPDGPGSPATVPHIRIDAALDPAAQLAAVLTALGPTTSPAD